jgi:hypothetical protein
MLASLQSIMIGLGKWTRTVDMVQSVQPKARRKSFKGKSSLSKKGLISDSGESAAVHYVESNLASFSDETGEGDNDPAVVRTVEKLSVAGNDAPVKEQEKETRSEGGIPSQ